jgi:predicted RNA binding protein YcfA (HicA-like mRNA interferase family)
MKIKEIIKVLEEDGWSLARTRGSHRQFKHPSKPGTVTVSGKTSVDIPLGTLNSIEAGGLQ